MTVDRTELAKRVIEHWDDPAFLGDWAHPEIEFEMTGPGRETVHGVEAMQEAFTQFLKSWNRFQTVAEEAIELEDGRILVLTLFQGHGKESGIPIEGMRGAALFGFRDDKVASLSLYPIRDEGLAAAGLPDGGASPGGNGAQND
jgi:hypothetical protein